ncbi:hypothetical protein SCHPADRAFT_897518 [Schizopora paradoxa]|uniref:Uncharacterized protein n=1 Tax=Schizopora paradoxa TaxID=27342 RepID=A0A0H2QXX6_9AGAM|nr:hypothetical protein SCHPADRAFT_897518 [Schizopora paradoxa]
MAGKKTSRKKQDDTEATATPQNTQPANPPASKGKVKVEIPVIPWTRDGSKLVFSLLTSIEKDENRIVLCGKRPGEVCALYHDILLQLPASHTATLVLRIFIRRSAYSAENCGCVVIALHEQRDMRDVDTVVASGERAEHWHDMAAAVEQF